MPRTLSQLGEQNGYGIIRSTLLPSHVNLEFVPVLAPLHASDAAMQYAWEKKHKGQTAPASRGAVKTYVAKYLSFGTQPHRKTKCPFGSQLAHWGCDRDISLNQGAFLRAEQWHYHLDPSLLAELLEVRNNALEEGRPRCAHLARVAGLAEVGLVDREAEQGCV